MRVLAVIAMLTFLVVAAFAGDSGSPVEANGRGGLLARPAPETCLLPGAAALTGQLSATWQRCFERAPHSSAGATGAATGSISGNVTDESSGTPLEGACVLALGSAQFLRPIVGTARTDASGAYSVGDLPADQYKLWFVDCGATGTHIAEWYNNRPDFDSADDLTVAQGQHVDGIDAALAAGGGSVSGTVTEEGSGVTLPQVCVYVIDSNDDLAGGAVTDGSGSYTAGGLPAGQYRLEFEDCVLPVHHVFEWYDGETDIGSANVVHVTEGMKTANISVALARGASITGTVIEEGSRSALAGICVEAHDDTSKLRGVGITDASGSYSVGGLQRGSYTVLFYDCVPPRFHIHEWYDNAPDAGVADPVQVGGPGTIRTLINDTMAVGGSLSGRVTDRDTGSGLPGICAFVYATSGDGIATDVTDGAGAYEVGGLAQDSYAIWFVDCRSAPTHIPQWFSGTADFDSADEVGVTRRTTTTGIDASLVRGALISGMVTDEPSGRPLSDVCAYPVDSSFTPLGLGFTNGLGAYTMVVASGTYKVYFRDCASQPSHNPEWYNNRLTFDTANSVHAGAVGVKTGEISAALALSRAGDVSCEGDVTSVDAALILQYVAGLFTSLLCDNNADLNHDGDVTSVDAAILLQYVAGLLDHLAT